MSSPALPPSPLALARRRLLQGGAALAATATLAPGLATAAGGISMPLPRSFQLVQPAQALPPVAIYDERGVAYPIDRFRGRPVLFELWATWCGYCRRQIPMLPGLSQQTGLAVATVEVSGAPPSQARLILDRIGVGGLPLFVDSSGRMTDLVPQRMVPRAMLIDAQSRARLYIFGAVNWQDRANVDALRTVLMMG